MLACLEEKAVETIRVVLLSEIVQRVIFRHEKPFLQCCLDELGQGLVLVAEIENDMTKFLSLLPDELLFNDLGMAKQPLITFFNTSRVHSVGEAVDDDDAGLEEAAAFDQNEIEQLSNGCPVRYSREKVLVLRAHYLIELLLVIQTLPSQLNQSLGEVVIFFEGDGEALLVEVGAVHGGKLTASNFAGFVEEGKLRIFEVETIKELQDHILRHEANL
jgi:hypothetical protein